MRILYLENDENVSRETLFTMELKLKSNLLIALINRNGRIIIPSGTDCVMVGDTVVIVTTHTGFDAITDIYNNEDNGEGFITNRHDQSVLSLILTKYNIPSIKGVKSWTSGDWKTLNHMPFLDTRKRYN